MLAQLALCVLHLGLLTKQHNVSHCEVQQAMLKQHASGCTCWLALPDQDVQTLVVLMPVAELRQREVIHCYPADPIC